MTRADEMATADGAEPSTIRSGPILPTLLRLSLPTIAVLLAQTAVNIAEAFYVGRLGTDALAGVALVFPVFMLMMMTSSGGLGSGVASSVARAIGSGRRDDASALVLHAIVLGALFGGAFTAATMLLGPALYHALGGRGGALRAAVVYSDTIFAGSIAVWIVNLLAAALRGCGNVKIPARVTLVGAFVMIPISPALIFGFGPIPRFGIAGAGVAFGLYYGIAMFVLLRYMMSGRAGIVLTFAPLERRLFGDILKVGLPTAFNSLQTNLTVILVTGAVGLFGTEALAGYGIASRLDYVMIPILFGLSSAVLTMVGINIGAGQVRRAKQIAWRGALVGVLFSEIIGIAVAIDPGPWLYFFSRDPSVFAAGSTYLRIVAPAYGFLGCGFVLAFAAQGAGHTFWPVVGSFVRLCVAAGLGWLAVRDFGAGMPALAIVVAVSLACYAFLCALAMISKGVWPDVEAGHADAVSSGRPLFGSR